MESTHNHAHLPNNGHKKTTPPKPKPPGPTPDAPMTKPLKTLPFTYPSIHNKKGDSPDYTKKPAAIPFTYQRPPHQLPFHSDNPAEETNVKPDPNEGHPEPSLEDERTKPVDFAGLAKLDAAIHEQTQVVGAGLQDIYLQLAKTQSDIKKVTTDAGASAPQAVSQLPQFREDDLTYPLELFLEKTRLGDNDAYYLYEYLKRDPQSPELWDFIVKIAPKTADALILKSNLDILSPELIQALMVVGSAEKEFLDEDSRQTHTIFVIIGAELGSGGVGVVTKANYAFEDQWHLIPCVLKRAINGPSREAAFQDEIAMAQQIKKLVTENEHDSRTKHILSPIHVGKDFIIMPSIINKAGEKLSLSELYKKPHLKPQDLARIMAEAMQGNEFLSEHGIINVDFKPINILEGQEGAVLIDWGGFIDKKSLHGDNPGEIRGNTKDYSSYPVLKSKYAEFFPSDQDLEKNSGNVLYTNSYNSAHLIAMELDNQTAPGTTHKFALARSLAHYFQIKYSHIRPDYKFKDLGQIDKLYVEPIEIKDTEFSSPAEMALYALYKKLHIAPFHPYLFKENDFQNGIDDNYISTKDIIASLESIANLPQ